MKYAIERASYGVLNDTSPCKEAVRYVVSEATGFERWTIDINGLEELMSFIKKHGTVIVYESDFLDTGLPLIRIYDGYVE